MKLLLTCLLQMANLHHKLKAIAQQHLRFLLFARSQRQALSIDRMVVDSRAYSIEQGPSHDMSVVIWTA
jgi:hypothetical protein